MKVAITVGFMKPRVPSMLFIMDNYMILRLTIYIIIIFFLEYALSILPENQIKIIITKKTKINTQLK